MKVRVQGNSIRLRLQQEDVATLARDGTVETRLEFGSDADTQHLVYRIESADIPDINVAYQAHCVCVKLPVAQIQDWATSNEVGFEHDVLLDGGGSMHVLIEKDFKCINVRPDESDCFPNPNITC